MKSEHRKQLIIAGALALLFCIGGVALVTLGFFKYAESRAFVTGAKEARGEVIEFETYDAPGISTWDDIHYAMIAYRTEDGRDIRFKGPSKDGLVRLNQGDVVHVLYDPNAPQSARVDSFMGLWFATTMLWAVGGGAITIPLLTLWEAWKWVRRQEEAHEQCRKFTNS